MTTTESKTHWKKFFNPDYLGAYSIEDGKDLILVIKSVCQEKVKGVGGKEQECLVAHFEGKTKPMILNRTNCKTIQKIYRTPHIEDWAGKLIQVYVKDNIDAFGSITDGLRIREFVPKAPNKTAEKKVELKTEIRNVLAELKPTDMKTVIGELISADDIRAMLNKANQEKRDTVEFLEVVLKDLKA